MWSLGVAWLLTVEYPNPQRRVSDAFKSGGRRDPVNTVLASQKSANMRSQHMSMSRVRFIGSSEGKLGVEDVQYLLHSAHIARA